MKKIVLAVSCLMSTSALGATLSDALVSAYQTNPELIAAREKLKVTDEEIFKAISGFLPKIEYSATQKNQKSDIATNSIFLSQLSKQDPWVQTKTKNSGVNLEQNVFSGGRSVMAVQIAKYTIESARAELLTSEQKVMIQAIQAYLEVLRHKEVLRINKNNFQAYETRYKSIKDRVEAGIEKRSNLFNAEARKANASVLLTRASGDYDIALADYFKIIGVEPENLSEADNLTKIPENQMGLLNNSLKGNPDLINVMLQKKAADVNVIAKGAVMLPTIDVGGGVNKSWSSLNGNMNQPYTNSKSVYITVKIPIYQQGMEYSNTRAAYASASALKYTVKNVKNVVTQEASKTWNNYISAKEAFVSSKEAVKAAKIALEGMQHEYDEGVGSLTDLMDIQENYYQYELTMIKNKEDAMLAEYAMSQLEGKLNAKDLELPTKIYNVSENYDKIKFRLIGF
jgi:outer membrane protein